MNDQITTTVNIMHIVGINSFVKKQFDMCIEKKKKEICKKNRWKISDCSVVPIAKIEVTFYHEPKEKKDEDEINFNNILKEEENEDGKF